MSTETNGSSSKPVEDEDDLTEKAIKHSNQSQEAVTPELTRVHALLAQQYCKEMLRKKRKDNCA